MKKQITKALLGVGMLFVLVASVSAQTAQRVAAQIPFDFIAAGKRLPAGHYTVRRVSSENEKTILIRSDDGHEVAIVSTDSSGDDQTPQSASLSFRQYGDSYFLAAVSIPGTADVRVLSESKAERRLARELAEKAKGGGDVEKTVTVTGSL